MHRQVILLILFSLALSKQVLVSPRVDTKYGTVTGESVHNAVVWRGIPFASPPVGDLRWAAPVPHSSWSGVKNATEFAPACPQACDLPPIFCPEQTSEDCLYLNVYSPLYKSDAELLPVMVFIAGGAFVQGDASCPIYRGELNSNETETILVTFNYRLGPLGFMVYGSKITGNYGLQDQRLALQWVQDNIKAFGGDPTRVTLFGESAGASSIGAHLMSKKSEGLFHRAIMESNPISLPYKSQYQAQQFGAHFASLVGCAADDMKCFRGLDVSRIVAVSDNNPWPALWNISLQIVLPWDPVIDGEDVPMQLMTAVESDQIRHMPMIIGTNVQEAVLFVYFELHTRLVNAEFDALILAIWGRQHYFSIKTMYPSSWNPLHDHRPLAAEMLTDYMFVCPNRRLARGLSKHSNVYAYSFDHNLSFDQYGPKYQACIGKVCHGNELPFVFHSADQKGVDFTAEEEILTRQILGYWTNFATSQDESPNYTPNQDLMPVTVPWPKMDESMKFLNLSTPIGVQTNTREPYCDFWDKLGYNWRR